MKSLKESLFDSDIIEKDLKFGDMYEPVEVLYPSTSDIKNISNMFVMSKLKKETHPLSLDGVYGYDQFKKLLDFLPYVLSKIAEMPLEEKFISTKTDGNYINYEFLMKKMFKNYIRNIRTNFTGLYFTMMIYDWKPMLQIRKSNMQGLATISIKYNKK